MARNYLIIQPGTINQLVYTLPAVELLKRNDPDAQIFWLIRSNNRFLIGQRNEHIYGIDEFSHFNLFKILKKYRYHTILNTASSLVWRNLPMMLHHEFHACILKDPNLHYSLRVMKAIDCTIDTPQNSTLHISEETVSTVKDYIDLPYIVLAPQSDVTPNKLMLTDWKFLMIKLPLKFKIYIIGTARYRDLFTDFKKYHPNLENLCGKLPPESIPPLLRSATAVLTGESPYLGIASAVESNIIFVCRNKFYAEQYKPLTTDLKISYLESIKKRNVSKVISAYDYFQWTKGNYSEDELFRAIIIMARNGFLINLRTEIHTMVVTIAVVEKAIAQFANRNFPVGHHRPVLLCADMRMAAHYLSRVPSITFEILDKTSGFPVILRFSFPRNLPENFPVTDETIDILLVQNEKMIQLISQLGYPLFGYRLKSNVDTTEENEMKSYDHFDFLFDIPFDNHSPQNPAIFKVHENHIELITRGELPEKTYLKLLPLISS